MSRKRTQKKTYTEFLSWLEGVESMQEDNWVPTEQQWKKIREMLNNVKPDIVESKKTSTQSSTVPAGPVARFIERPGGPVIPQSTMHVPPQSAFEQPKQSVPQRPPVPSGIPQPPKGGKPNMLDPGELHGDDEFV